jgi:ribosomal protein S18 acetylase RimI-like enzyme
MTIRELRRTDVQAVQGLLRQLGYDVPLTDLMERIERVLGANQHYAAVAEASARMLGLVHVFERPALERPSAAVVQSLIVDAGSRHAGVGRALMAAAEQWARARQLKHVVLHTRIDRDDARAFYMRLGYDIAATSHLMLKEPEAD